jgi:hypothetical protein
MPESLYQHSAKNGGNEREPYGVPIALRLGPIRIGARRVFNRLCKAGLIALPIIVCSAGCSFNVQPAFTGLSLAVTKPIVIPLGRAHAILQGGQLASASNKLEPYCELEVRTVSEGKPQRITTGNFQVSQVTNRLLLDPTTRIPAIFLATSCSDPLFQEGVWWLKSAEPSDVMFLRCIAPYYNCAFGPPLPPEQVQQQVGHYLTIQVADSAARPP